MHWQTTFTVGSDLHQLDGVGPGEGEELEESEQGSWQETAGGEDEESFDGSIVDFEEAGFVGEWGHSSEWAEGEAFTCGLAEEMEAICEANGLVWQALAAATPRHKLWHRLEAAFCSRSGRQSLVRQGQFVMVVKGAFIEVFGSGQPSAAWGGKDKSALFLVLAEALRAAAADG